MDGQGRRHTPAASSCSDGHGATHQCGAPDAYLGIQVSFEYFGAWLDELSDGQPSCLFSEFAKIRPTLLEGNVFIDKR